MANDGAVVQGPGMLIGGVRVYWSDYLTELQALARAGDPRSAFRVGSRYVLVDCTLDELRDHLSSRGFDGPFEHIGALVRR